MQASHAGASQATALDEIQSSAGAATAPAVDAATSSADWRARVPETTLRARLDTLPAAA
jgi:hypothetical protein